MNTKADIPPAAVPMDGRVPVVVAGDVAHAAPGDTVLAIDAARRAHPIGCGCCRARDPLADALGRAFLRAARGDTPPLRLIVVVSHDAAGVAAVIAADVVAQARFRFAGMLAAPATARDGA